MTAQVRLSARRPSSRRRGRPARPRSPAGSCGRSRAPRPPARRATVKSGGTCRVETGCSATYRPMSPIRTGRSRGFQPGTGRRRLAELVHLRHPSTVRPYAHRHATRSGLARGDRRGGDLRGGLPAGAGRSRAGGCSTRPAGPAAGHPALALHRLLHGPEQHPGRGHRGPARPRPGPRRLRWRVAAAGGGRRASRSPGVVHFFLLRPLLDLDGADYVADKLLHMVVPVLAFVGWALFGPRPRIDWREHPAGRSAGRSPGSPWSWSSAASPAGTPTRSSTTASPRAPRESWSPASGSRCSSWSCSGWPGCATAALSVAAMTSRTLPKRHRLRRVRGSRRLVGAPAPLRRLRPRRLLRHLADAARHRALPRDRPPRRAELRARRGLVLGLRDARRACSGPASPRPPAGPTTSPSRSRRPRARPTGANTSTDRLVEVSSRDADQP